VSGPRFPESSGVERLIRMKGGALRPASENLACRAFAFLAVLLCTAPAHAAGDLVLFPEPQLLLMLIVFFVALVFPINNLIFKPIFQALDEREERIAGARQRAVHIEAEADKVLARFEAAIREARSGAEVARKEHVTQARGEQASIGAAARAEAEQRVEAARAELERSLAEARSGLQATSRDLAAAAAESILGRPLS